jgi:hypothetical protein
MTEREEIDAARERILEIHAEVTAFDSNVKTIQTKVDWGKSKGQGKRSGGMVKGGMGFGCSGVVCYTNVDMREYKDEIEKYGHHRLIRDVPYNYVHGRQFGLTHIEAAMYAILKNKGKIA